MMKRDIILIIIIILGFLSLKAEIPVAITKNIIFTKNKLCNKLSESDVIYLKIKNESKIKFYFWISTESNKKFSDEQLIRRYFFKRGNCSNSISFYDYISSNRFKEEYYCSIGFNFIKILEPNQTFNIIVDSNNCFSKSYDSHIVIIEKETVDKIIGVIDNKFIYPEDTLLIQ